MAADDERGDPLDWCCSRYAMVRIVKEIVECTQMRRD